MIVHDRLALYWKLKKAKHGLCAAHLLRDLASVAEVATQAAWVTGLAGLLVEVNACDAARAAGHRRLALTLQRGFRARYDALVADGLAANLHQQPSRAGPPASEDPSEDLLVLPQPGQRRALRQRPQLPLHHPQERRRRARGTHSPLQRRPLDAI